MKFEVTMMNDKEQWTELMDIPEGESPQSIVDKFNASLQPGDLSRILISAGPVEFEVLELDKSGPRIVQTSEAPVLAGIGYVACKGEKVYVAIYPGQKIGG